MLQISPASTSDEITGLDDPDGLMNRTAPPDSLQGPTLANYIEQELGGAEGIAVNVGARDDAYGTGLADSFGTAWEDKGGTVGEEVIYDPAQPSYDSEASLLGRQPGRVRDHRLLRDLRQARPGARPDRQLGSQEDVCHGRPDHCRPSENRWRGSRSGFARNRAGHPEKGEAPEAFDQLYEQSNPKTSSGCRSMPKPSTP